jgi:pimeloyl-ACP methyl ester carboxylesterase
MGSKANLAVVIGMFVIAAGLGPATGADLVSIRTPRGVQQAFILVAPPEKPVAAVILFAGLDGALGLTGPSSMKQLDANFLVRTRDKFAAHGFLVAVVDAPSDHKNGMDPVFRVSSAHAGDIEAVAAHLKQQADVPVWLIGTSMGTFSAANGAIAANNVSGLVLTSTITRPRPDWPIAQSHGDGVASMALAKVTVPALIVAHRHDQCPSTPPSGAARLKGRLTNAAKAEVVLLDGGAPPQSEPCRARAQHGFFGIETQAVDAIADFIKANTL